jgi:VanZ family protein
MYKLLFWVWAIIILALCSIPGKEIPKLSLWEHTDKIVHIGVFAVLAFFYQKHYRGKIIGILLMIIYGFAIEWHQENFIMGRHFDIWDGVADAIGVGIGLGIANVSKLRS